MDFPTFVVRIIAASAWPTLVAFMFWNVRARVNALIDRIRSLKWRDAEASFGEQLDDIRDEITGDDATKEELPSTGETAHKPAVGHHFIGFTSGATGTDLGKKLEYVAAIERLSGAAPSYVIDQSWSELVVALRLAAQSRGADFPKDIRWTKRLSRDLGLSEGDEAAIRDLRRLRNEAVYDMGTGRVVTSTDALRYRDLATALINRIEAVGRSKKS